MDNIKRYLNKYNEYPRMHCVTGRVCLANHYPEAKSKLKWISGYSISHTLYRHNTYSNIVK